MTVWAGCGHLATSVHSVRPSGEEHEGLDVRDVGGLPQGFQYLTNSPC
jgi:hypothetical protein